MMIPSRARCGYTQMLIVTDMFRDCGEGDIQPLRVFPELPPRMSCGAASHVRGPGAAWPYISPPLVRGPLLVLQLNFSALVVAPEVDI